MLIRTFTVTGTLGILCIWLVSFSTPFNGKPENKSEMFTIYQSVNLPSEEAEIELVRFVRAFNEVLKETGYNGVRYRIRKQKSDRPEVQAYFIESTWPDRATYDRVHRNRAWRDLSEKYGKVFEGTID